MKMELRMIDIDRISTGKRIREDLGDIDSLARSINEFGLLSPVLVNANNLLVSGLRRLQACRKLGHSQIQAIVVDVDDENLLFHIESQENLCRKSFTPQEVDKEIEIKRKFALSRIRGKSVLGNLWNKFRGLFRKKD